MTEVMYKIGDKITYSYAEACAIHDKTHQDIEIIYHSVRKMSPAHIKKT